MEVGWAALHSIGCGRHPRLPRRTFCSERRAAGVGGGGGGGWCLTLEKRVIGRSKHEYAASVYSPYCLEERRSRKLHCSEFSEVRPIGGPKTGLGLSRQLVAAPSSRSCCLHSRPCQQRRHPCLYRNRACPAAARRRTRKVDRHPCRHRGHPCPCPLKGRSSCAR